MSYFSSQLRAACQLRRVPLSTIAAESGIDQSTISRITNGERQMTIENLRKICDHVSVFNETDKLGIIKAWLIDNTPEQFRDRVIINAIPSSLRETETDDLTAALRFLEKTADNTEFRAWLLQLVKMLRGKK